MKLIAKTLAGLEGVLAQELENLGAQNIEPLKRAVAFEGDLSILYKANLELRTALRILLPIASFRARNEEQLYRRIYDIDWSQYMKVDDTLAVDSVVSSNIFRHSKYVALKVKDAVVDQFRNKSGLRPSVNIHHPTLRINIHIHNDQCSLALDSSGDSLHKRGYRVEALEAPINEVLAAGMILLSGWKQDCCFIDPMCGSGTIVIEAALMATNRAPNLNRKHFAFMKWADYDAALWDNILSASKAKIKAFEYGLYGFDKDFKARRIAQHNRNAAGLEEVITIERMQIERLEAPEEKGILIMNPPYDERLVTTDISSFYAMVGDRLKQTFSGYDAWIISSNIEALKNVGLKVSKRLTLFNGALECKYHHYELYTGSKRDKQED
jgi:putative N6-adenine-specific DNA methylase